MNARNELDALDAPKPDRDADLLPVPDVGVLDNVAWSALTGPHAYLAEGRSRALRYPPDMSIFAALPTDLDDQAFQEMTELYGPGQTFALAVPPETVELLPAAWEVTFRMAGLQLIATEALTPRPEPEAVQLGADDVEEMLDLVRRTDPGPFAARTYQLGRYLGIRRDGALVAMAGERMHPPGFTEISAVCTDPAFRGQGLARRLVLAIADGIQQRGETPYLHTAVSNVNARRLYESIGFVVRRELRFLAVQLPATS